MSASVDSRTLQSRGQNQNQNSLPREQIQKLVLEASSANVHQRATFYKMGTHRGHFVVNREWNSEEFNSPKFAPRTHRPWPYEFPGARNYNPEGAPRKKGAHPGGIMF